MNNFPLHLVISGGVGLLLGVAAVRFSPLLMLVVLAAVGATIAAIKRPEIALLGILMATSSIIFEDRLPLIPVGILGSLHIPDLFLLALLGLILLRWLVEPDFKIIRTPLDLPLLAFYGTALLSTFIAVYQSSVEFHMARRGIRIVSYYLTFFIATNLVREKHQLTLLLRGLFLLATIVALTMVAQFILGESVSFLPGRVETLSTQGKSYIGITRILPPGLSLVMVAFITVTATLVLDRFKPISIWRFFQPGLLGLAVVLTFLRSYWVVVGVFLLLLLYLVKGHDRRRLIGWGFMILFLIAIIVLAAFYDPESRAANLMKASFARLVTLISSEVAQESSLQFRYVENEYAYTQIMSNPLLGLGLGSKYRPWDPRIDWKDPNGASFDGRAFLHNGHLWIMMKTGLLGYSSLLWLSVTFLVRGFRHWRCISNSQIRGIVLGFTLAYLGIVIAAVVNSTFVEWYWTPLLGIMMGINEVVLRNNTREEPVN